MTDYHNIANKPAPYKEQDLQQLKVGVLAIQGAVSEHMEALEKCGAAPVAVRRSSLLRDLDGLIIPGGESTTIGRLSKMYGYQEEIAALASQGKPLFGTCAGLILLAEEVEGQKPILPLLSVKVRRNAFGRQRESFETDLELPVLGDEPFRGVFIRAPLIISVGHSVEILCRFQEQVVAVRERNLIGTSFHPELTDDLRLHRLFLEMALNRHGGKITS